MNYYTQILKFILSTVSFLLIFNGLILGAGLPSSYTLKADKYCKDKENGAYRNFYPDTRTLEMDIGCRNGKSNGGKFFGRDSQIIRMEVYHRNSKNDDDSYYMEYIYNPGEKKPFENRIFSDSCVPSSVPIRTMGLEPKLAPEMNIVPASNSTVALVTTGRDCADSVADDSSRIPAIRP